MNNDVVFLISVFSLFLRNHGADIDDRDWRNLQVGLKLLKKFAPERWLKTHEYLYSDTERRSAVLSRTRMPDDAKIVLTMLRSFVRSNKKELAEKTFSNLIIVTKIIRRYT